MLVELFDAIRESLGAKERVTHVQGVPLTILKGDDGREHPFALEHLCQKPQRARGNVETANWRSFAEMVVSLRAGTTARVYAKNNGSLRSILNDDGTEPGFKDWLVDYAPVFDESWQAWSKMDNQWGSQLSTAEFIQERAADFVDPTAASMLELAQQFDVVRGGKFKSGTRLDSGASKLLIEDDARADGIVIPTEVKLGMRVFEDLDAYSFKAFFRWRITDQGLKLSFKIHDRARIVQQAVEDLLDRLINTMPEGTKFIMVSALPGPTPRL